MQSLRKAVVLALSLSLAMGGPLAEARPTQSSGSYKSGFSSQRSSTARSTPSRSPSAAPSPSRGSFGTFGSRSTDADAAPASGGSRSAMNRDMTQKSAEDRAVRTMEERTAQQRQLPPSDPVMPRQAPQYGNNQYGTGGYSNGGSRDPRYDGGGYSQERSSRWGTAGAAAAGAVLGSVLASGAHANQVPQQQQQLPTNIPADVGSIGPVGSSGSSTSPDVATVPNPMNPDAPAATPAPQVQEQQATRPARKESSGIGWFGWVMLGVIGYALYKVFTRRKVARQGANYTLGD
jgi:hypothetical protein